MLWLCLNIHCVATCVSFHLTLFLHTSTTFVHLFYCQVSITCPSVVYLLLTLYSFTTMGDLNVTEKFFTSSDTDNLEVEELLDEDCNHPHVSYLHLVYMFLDQMFDRPIQNAQVKYLMKRVYINMTLLARLLLIWIWTLRFLHPMKLVVWWNWMINMTKCVIPTILSNMSDSLC